MPFFPNTKGKNSGKAQRENSASRRGIDNESYVGKPLGGIGAPILILLRLGVGTPANVVSQKLGRRRSWLGGGGLGRTRSLGRIRSRGLGRRFGHDGSGHIVDRRLTEPDTHRMELAEVGIH